VGGKMEIIEKIFLNVLDCIKLYLPLQINIISNKTI